VDHRGNETQRRRGEFEVDGTRVSFGGATADRGDLVASYAAVLATVRATRPGDALRLRTDDLEVLALAVGADGHDVEARIRGLLGCTAEEARRIHKELVRRRLLQPVAALAVGTAIIWGPAAAARGDRPHLGSPEPSTTVAVTPAPTPASAGAASATDVADIADMMGTGPQMTSDFGSAPTTTVPAAPETTVDATPLATEPEAAQPEVAVDTPVAAEPETAATPDVGILPGEEPTAVVTSP